MKINRKAVIIIAIVALVVVPVIIGIIHYVTHYSGSPEAYVEREAIRISRDKDTGEIIEENNNHPEKNEAPSVLILGMEELIRQKVLSPQVRIIREQLGDFANERLDGKYDSITLRPQDLTNTDGIIVSTIRLGQSDTLLPVTITAKNTGETGVTVNDPDNIVGGDYTGEIITLHAD